MSLRFTAHTFPFSQNKELFGCVQTTYKIKTEREKVFEKKKCTKCSCYLVPTENDFLDCPICNTKANYVRYPVKVGDGFSKISYFSFIFDVTISKEKIVELLKQLIECLSEDDHVLFIGLGKSITILYINGSSPTLLNIDKLSNFNPDKSYFVSKSQIEKDIFHLISIYYNISECGENIVCEIITPLQISVRQHNLINDQFAIMVFTHRDVQPMPAEKAHNLGKYIASNLGIVHFGARHSFKRLTAVARASLGCVFGLNEIAPNTILKLVELSQTTRTKIITPRCLEAIKVTGAEGNLRMNTRITLLKLSSTRGFSVRYAVDFSRSKSFSEVVPILEFTTNSEGQFLCLSLLRRSKSQEEYVGAMNAAVSRAIVLKGLAADILKSVWIGTDFEKTIKQQFSKNEAAASIASDSSLKELGVKPDRDCLRLYYAVYSLFNPIRNIKIEDERGKLLSSLHVVYIRTEDDKNYKVLEKVDSEWPYELRSFSDDVAFDLILKTTMGEKHQ